MASDFQKVGHVNKRMERDPGSFNPACLKHSSSCGCHCTLPLKAVRAIAAMLEAVRVPNLPQPSTSKFVTTFAGRVPPGNLQIFVPAQDSICSIDFGGFASCTM